MTIRRGLITVVLVALTFGLAACGGQAPEPVFVNASEPAGTVDPTPTTSALAAADPTPSVLGPADAVPTRRAAGADQPPATAKSPTRKPAPNPTTRQPSPSKPTTPPPTVQQGDRCTKFRASGVTASGKPMVCTWTPRRHALTWQPA